MRSFPFFVLALFAIAVGVHAAQLKSPAGKLLEYEPALKDGSTPCSKEDYPDSPIHAFRDAQGKIQVVIGNRFSRRLIGTNFDNLKRDCRVIFQGKENKDPTHHSYRGWVHATYTENGQIIYALIHNEFHGHRIFPECKNNYQHCWWNDVDWATSVDGGKTYTSPEPDKRLVIGLAQSYKPNIGQPVGFMNPSTIIEQGGYLYSIVHGMAYANQADGSYLIRKAKSAPWSEWEVWNGRKFISVNEEVKDGGPVGEILDLGKDNTYTFSDPAPMKVQSLVQHTPSGKFVVLMSSKQPAKGNEAADGFYIGTSDDLVNWSKPVQLVQANLRPGVDCKKDKQAGPIEYYRYATLLDPASADRNFTTVGNKVYLYTTRISGETCAQQPKKQELIRIPLTLDIK